MKVLRKGDKGKEVIQLQYFLLGLNFYLGEVDNDFGPQTHKATIKFQQKYKLSDDGVVGRMTYAKAISLGFGTVKDDNTDIYSANYPPRPSIQLLNSTAKQQLFGKIEFIADPTPKNKERIKITNNYRKDNIVMVRNLYLAKATNGKYTRMLFHKDCEYQLLQLFKEWDEEGLLDLILSYGGSFIARFIRGSRTNLSNHSYGTAFDINMQWNRLGSTPALVGKLGSVRKLVEIAYKWGFYWGGWYKNRKDGMHFEAFKIIPKP